MTGPSSREDGRRRRFLVLLELIDKLGDGRKTQIQKLVYFLQEEFPFSSSYRFRMHHYGPYSSELDDDLLSLKVEGYLSIAPDPGGYGFHVSKKEDAPVEWGRPGTQERRAIDQVIERFGRHEVSALELQATIHYVCKSKGSSPAAVLPLVKQLKPKFVDSYIESTFDQMRDQGLLPH